MSDEPSPADLAAGSSTRRGLLRNAGGAVAVAGGVLALGGMPRAEATVSDASYYSYGPFRYVDTRVNSGGRISNGQTRNLDVFAGLASYTFAINLTVVSTKGANGSLALYNADKERPKPYWSITWQGDSRFVCNFQMLDLGAAGANVYCGGGTGVSTHFVIDVVGFFLTGGAAAQDAPQDFKEWERKARHSLRDQM